MRPPSNAADTPLRAVGRGARVSQRSGFGSYTWCRFVLRHSLAHPFIETGEVASGAHPGEERLPPDAGRGPGQSRGEAEKFSTGRGGPSFRVALPDPGGVLPSCGIVLGHALIDECRDRIHEAPPLGEVQ